MYVCMYTCLYDKDLDQPATLYSLIRDFALRFYIL